MDESVKFKFRIVKCEEIKFKTELSSALSLDENKLTFNFGFRIVPVEKNKVSIIIAVRYLYEGEEILYHENSCTFEFGKMSDVLEFSDAGKVNDKANIIPTLLSISYSSARGMLAVRTAGSPLVNSPIPVVNPMDILKNAK